MRHVGRGGTGNVVKYSSDEAEAARGPQDGNAKGLAEKGKEWLMGKK